ncbi:hypothetical protein BgiMline_020982 [Biomphalaria glabrata]|nr:hypothetical protein BgiMline_018146 [Biomphalaria glabrata]
MTQRGRGIKDHILGECRFLHAKGQGFKRKSRTNSVRGHATSCPGSRYSLSGVTLLLVRGYVTPCPGSGYSLSVVRLLLARGLSTPCPGLCYFLSGVRLLLVRG